MFGEIDPTSGGGARKRSCSALIVDPSPRTSLDLIREFQSRGHACSWASSKCEAEYLVHRADFKIAVVELRFQDGPGFDLIELISELQPNCQIFVYSTYCDLRATVRAVKSGAYEVLPKPLDPRFVAGFVIHGVSGPSQGLPIPQPSVVRRNYIEAIFQGSDQNVSRAARSLSMDRRSLQRFLKRHQIGPSVVKIVH